MLFRRQHGFTLIELLVVIMIIMILAAILFPVLNSARRSAMKASCISNEKQILHGIMMYVQDNSGYMPLGYSTEANYAYDWLAGSFAKLPSAAEQWSPYSRPLLWHHRILKYMKSADLFICPAVPISLLMDASLFKPNKDSSNVFGKYPTTYGYNWRLTTNNGGPAQLPPTTGRAQLAQAGVFGQTVAAESLSWPSRTICICESQYAAQDVVNKTSSPKGGGILVYSDVGDYYWNMRWLTKPYVPRGHEGGANFGLVDGHVKYVKGLQPNGRTAPTESSVEKAGLRWW